MQGKEKKQIFLGFQDVAQCLQCRVKILNATGPQFNLHSRLLAVVCVTRSLIKRDI